MASPKILGFIPQAMTHSCSLTNPHHSPIMHHSTCLPNIQTGVLLRVEWSTPLVPPWVNASHFLVGNREDELKLIHFSSLLLFCHFLSFLFSLPHRDIVPLSVVCRGYSLIENIETQKIFQQKKAIGCGDGKEIDP